MALFFGGARVSIHPKENGILRNLESRSPEVCAGAKQDVMVFLKAPLAAPGGIHCRWLMSSAFVLILSLFSAGLTAYIVCELVEIVAAVPFGATVFCTGRAIVRLCLLLFGQFLGVLCTAAISAFAILEFSALLNVDSEGFRLWLILCSCFGLALAVVALFVSPRFREEIWAGADRRVRSSYRGSIRNGHARFE